MSDLKKAISILVNEKENLEARILNFVGNNIYDFKEATGVPIKNIELRFNHKSANRDSGLNRHSLENVIIELDLNS